MNDFEAMSSRCADLARQLTAMERKYDTAMIHIRALTAAAADMLADPDRNRADRLLDAVEAALSL